MGSGGGSRDRSRSAHRTNPPHGDNNMYRILQDNATENELSSVNNNRRKNVNKKFPPFTIFNTSVKVFKDHLSGSNAINVNNIHIRLTSHGMKVFVQNDKVYKSMHKFLVDNKFQFFSHTLNDERKQKICLYGLWQMSVVQLKSELNAVGVVPTEIKTIDIRNKRYNDQCIYLLYFMRCDNIKMTDLRRIKYVANCVVKWEFYSPRAKGPTQCSRCQNYGHGSDNCYMSPKCVRCGEQHDSNLCKYLPKIKDKDGAEVPDATKKIPLNNVQCANCRKKSHTANFKGCEFRQKYLEVTKISRNNRTMKPKISKPVPHMRPLSKSD